MFHYRVSILILFCRLFSSIECKFLTWFALLPRLWIIQSNCFATLASSGCLSSERGLLSAHAACTPKPLHPHPTPAGSLDVPLWIPLFTLSSPHLQESMNENTIDLLCFFFSFPQISTSLLPFWKYFRLMHSDLFFVLFFYEILQMKMTKTVFMWGGSDNRNSTQNRNISRDFICFDFITILNVFLESFTSGGAQFCWTHRRSFFFSVFMAGSLCCCRNPLARFHYQ